MIDRLHEGIFISRILYFIVKYNSCSPFEEIGLDAKFLLSKSCSAQALIGNWKPIALVLEALHLENELMSEQTS